MKKSGIYKFRGHIFRYDFTNGLVERLAKATQQELEDNAEWLAKYGKPLWDIDSDGYIEIEAVGLLKENWQRKAVRDEYLAEWIEEIEEDAAIMAADLVAEFGI